MRLTDLLTPEAVISSLKATSKKQALLELSEKAAELSGLAAREIFDALLQRERLGSTGIGDGVAIPHGKLMKLKNIFGIFAQTRAPYRLRGAGRRSGRSDFPFNHAGKLRRGPFEGARLRRAGVARPVDGRDNPRDARRRRVIFPARATLAAPRGLGPPRWAAPPRSSREKAAPFSWSWRASPIRHAKRVRPCDRLPKRARDPEKSCACRD